MNTHELNEDLLTRYVLGELTEEEARAVKEALIANPEARRTIAEIEQTVGLLKDALGGEAVVGLGEVAKEEINAEARRMQSSAERKPWSIRKRLPLYAGTLAVAACGILGIGLILYSQAGVVSPFIYTGPAENWEWYKPVSTTRQGYRSAVAGSPDPATATTEGLQSPPPVAEPLRYSEAQTAAGSEVPSSPRTEADAAVGAEVPPQQSATASEARRLTVDPLTGEAKFEDIQRQGVISTGASLSYPAATKAAPERHRTLSETEASSLPSAPESVGRELMGQLDVPATEGLQLKSAAPLGDLSVEGVAGSETPPQQSAPPPPKPEPKREAAARSIESTESTLSEEQMRSLINLGYLGFTTETDSYQAYMRRPRPGGEQYNPIVENPFKPVANEPLSTFSIDVDTGAYSNMRRYIEAGSLPPADAVRIEELINYFEYGYPKQTYEAGADPFSAAVSVAACPWTPGHKLVRVGIQGASMPEGQRPLSNLVFLLDVSGSMQDHTKLPLLKRGLQMLVNQLGENDKVSIVVYAGSAGMVLPPTNGSNRPAILSAIENLSAGGSTAGGEGIQLAYRLARENFIEGGVNRVILATDGDFNVGVSDQAGLIRLIEEQAKSKVFLTVLGFGTGNLHDGMMEQLSNKGNGMYAYIDSLKEAKKVFVEQAEGSLITIAKDVKIQIEFNPARVQSYRLIGYENRALAAQDFNDDTKDAGEIGAGHQVTALYEIVPVGGMPQEGVDPLKYQKNTDEHRPAPTDTEGELMTLKLRYKQPEGDVSKLLEYPIVDSTMEFNQADADFRFASSVAAFGMLLRGSQHKGSATVEQVQSWASNALGDDPHGYRTEFLDLVRKASMMR